MPSLVSDWRTKSGHDAEVLGDDARAAPGEDSHQALAKCKLVGLVRRIEAALVGAERTREGAIEAHEVVDAIAVEQPRAALARVAAAIDSRRDAITSQR